MRSANLSDVGGVKPIMAGQEKGGTRLPRLITLSSSKDSLEDLDCPYSEKPALLVQRVRRLAWEIYISPG